MEHKHTTGVLQSHLQQAGVHTNPLHVHFFDTAVYGYTPCKVFNTALLRLGLVNLPEKCVPELPSKRLDQGGLLELCASVHCTTAAISLQHDLCSSLLPSNLIIASQRNTRVFCG